MGQKNRRRKIIYDNVDDNNICPVSENNEFIDPSLLMLNTKTVKNQNYIIFVNIYDNVVDENYFVDYFK
jgi:hypothetical protein